MLGSNITQKSLILQHSELYLLHLKVMREYLNVWKWDIFGTFSTTVL